MRMRREEIDISAELRALRPAPRPEFTAELDSRAAAGFPQSGPRPIGRVTGLFRRLGQIPERLRVVPGRRLLAAAGTGAVAAIAVATGLVLTSESGPGTTAPTALNTFPSNGKSGSTLRAGSDRTAGARDERLGANDAGQTQFSAPVPSTGASRASAGNGELAPAAGTTRTGRGPYASQVPHRDVERSAQIVLVTGPTEVRGDAAKVFETVHAYRGIVLSSSIRDGRAGEAGATFELLVPSSRLGDAMAAFSDIAEVSSRHESTLDVTAQTIGLRERLQDARAKVKSLLGEVSGAASEAEREAAEAELRSARRHAAALRARLARVEEALERQRAGESE